jgi:hypothetical protein
VAAGRSSFGTAYATTTGMLSLSEGADGAASSSFSVMVGGIWSVFRCLNCLLVAVRVFSETETETAS